MIMYIHRPHKNMRPTDRQLRLICYPELRRRRCGSRTSKGRKTIDREVGRVNVWHANVSLVIQRSLADVKRSYLS